MASSFPRRRHRAAPARADSAALSVEQLGVAAQLDEAELVGGWPGRADWTAADQNCPRCAQRNAVPGEPQAVEPGALQVAELDALEDVVAVTARDESADGFPARCAAAAGRSVADRFGHWCRGRGTDRSADCYDRCCDQ